MKKLLIFLIVASCYSIQCWAASGDLIVNGAIGVGTTTPVVKLDVNGEAKLGNSGLVCSSSVNGAVRYNASSAVLEVCDGTTWQRVGVPAGTVIYEAANVCPAGYLKANGQIVSRSTYANLFAAIGTTFGAGDGATTFKLPDLRGEFIRGWDEGRGVDSGRGFGAWQADMLASHRHSIQGAILGGNGVGVPASDGYQGDWFKVNSTTNDFGGNETRPRNVALSVCIKY